jgi:hypothetical protein
MKRGWLDQELSFSQAAAELQREKDPIGRKLRNLVMARERETGKRIAIRLSSGKEPKLRITIGAIYRHLPELRPARVDDLARLVRPMLERQEERHDARTRILIREENERDVFPRLEIVEKKATAIENCLRELDALERLQLARTAKD